MKVLRSIFLCLAVTLTFSSCQLARALLRAPGAILGGLGNLNLLGDAAEPNKPFIYDAEAMKHQRQMLEEGSSPVTPAQAAPEVGEVAQAR